MKEIWKNVVGYEDYYEVSNLGNVKSKPRKIVCSNGRIMNKKSTILKQRQNNRGYHLIELYDDESKRTCLVHRLVAEAFIPNPDNKPQVNHINGSKSENDINNLEWNTQEENMKHSFDTGLRKATIPSEEQKQKMNEGKRKSSKMGGNKKKIAQLDLNTNEIIKVFNSAAEASRELKCDPSSITDVAGGKKNRKSCKGFGWKYL